MQIELTDLELGMCIASMEICIKELREGYDASESLNVSVPNISELIAQTEALRLKLRGIAGMKPIV